MNLRLIEDLEWMQVYQDKDRNYWFYYESVEDKDDLNDLLNILWNDYIQDNTRLNWRGYRPRDDDDMWIEPNCQFFLKTQMSKDIDISKCGVEVEHSQLPYPCWIELEKTNKENVYEIVF